MTRQTMCDEGMSNVVAHVHILICANFYCNLRSKWGNPKQTAPPIELVWNALVPMFYSVFTVFHGLIVE